jgi:hypothetical protein
MRAEPSPVALGLESLIDPEHQVVQRTNGLSRVAREREPKRLAGIEIDSDTPAPFTPLLLKGRAVGHTLRSVWSPAAPRHRAGADRCIGLRARHEADAHSAAVSGRPRAAHGRARVTALPFLKVPDSIAP